MNEKLLQYIWQMQYFNRSDLRVVSGEEVEVIHPGTLNTNQGPDFLNARVKVGGTLMAGSVELHLCSSQWWKHGHGPDPNYRNVILHVVLEHDGDKSAPVPTLELKGRIPGLLLSRYEQLMNAGGLIPCADSINKVGALVWASWRERLVAERLTRKSVKIFEMLKRNRSHWEETFWQTLARSFGGKLNGDLFEEVARSLPLNILGRHRNHLHQIEAMLVGQANLLEARFEEDYPMQLKREYRFLRKKYKFPPVHIRAVFHRMRPAGFPTLRLAQLAAFLRSEPRLLDSLLETVELKIMKEKLQVSASEYWVDHYRFDEKTIARERKLGDEMLDQLLINTLVPVLFSYGLYHQDEKLKERALNWLCATAAEENRITRGFSALGQTGTSAYDTQSLIELKTQYCDLRRCLACSVGNALLKNDSIGGLPEVRVH